MRLFPALPPALARFRRDDSGSISIEAMLIFPLLTWCYLAGFVWFDAFRAESLNEKATYAIGDIISREDGDDENPLNSAFMQSMLNLHRVMTFADKPTRLRVSVIEFSAADQTRRVVWSTRLGHGGNIGELQDSDINGENALAGKIPIMSGGENLIVVETWLPYEPIFNIGLDGFVFESFSVIRPRYTPQLCFDRNDSGDPLQMEC